MPPPPHLQIQNLNAWHGNRRILEDISLDLNDRQITAVIGPSGCGKTSLLRCMNRLLENTPGMRVTGRVLVDGEDLYAPGVEVTHIRKKMGLLAQRPQVLPMSIFDNVAYGPRIHGMTDRRLLEELVERHLRAAGLWDEVSDRLRAPAARLSVGQQQRLCLARGLAVEPEILLADEPTSALDPQSSQAVEACLQELKRNYTILFVTHILRQARRVADSVVFLYLGKVIEHGPAGEFFRNPRHELAKRYVQGEIS